MKPTIFNDRVARALRNWHHTARKHVKESRQTTPLSSRPATPSRHTSPIHLLRHYCPEMDNSDTESPSPSRFQRPVSHMDAEVELSSSQDHHITIHVSKEFSFDKRPTQSN